MRLAILDAANRLVDQHGIAALTLSAVAAEAGIARATIYGYFAGKQELLSLLSSSLDTRQPEPAVAAPKEEPAATPAVQPNIPLRKDETAIEISYETPDVPAKPDTPGDYDAMMRFQAAELDKLAKRVIVPKSQMKEGTDAVLSRLDTRIRLIEQSYAELQSRQSNDAKELAGQIGSAVDAVHQLQKRLESFDNKHQLALAEVRLDVHNLTSRTAVTAVTACPIPAATGEATLSTTAGSAEAQPQSAPSQIREPGTEPAYLSRARRATIEAAQKNEENDQAETGSRHSRWIWLLAAVLLAAGGIGLSLYLTSGRPAAAVVAHQSRQIAGNGHRQIHAAALVPVRLDTLAEAGNAQAQLILGLKLLNGTGLPMNIEKGASWIERAAVGGQAVAQNCLGVLYQTGTGVAVSMVHAVHWYEVAARQGNLRAMTNLGKIYAGGWKDVTDFAEAAHWFSLAAGMGEVDAQFDLAVLYQRGDGVPYSLIEAYKWYAIAASQGDRKAAAQLGLIAGRLMQNELVAARKAAADFRHAPVNRAANDAASPAAILASRS